MSRNCISYKGLKFVLDDKPMHQGGEGAIYRIISGGSDLVAKIYHTHQKAVGFYQKILFMVKNSPFINAPDEIRNAIIWPKDLLFENGQFIGYVMPLVENGKKLFVVNQPGFPNAAHGADWQKFNRSRPDALLVRMKVCYNLAKALDLLHKSGKYVLVDMKPENILIKPTAHFSLIDIDSIQISQNHQLLFPATAYTPEYAPQEFHNGKIDPKNEIVQQSFDNFSVAVILYQVLLSIHPFQASHNKYTTIAENIANGLYVHGPKRKHLHVIPPPHNLFNFLPKPLRKLFDRALNHGSVNPGFRPTAEEWAKVLVAEIDAFKPGKNKFFQAQTHSGFSVKTGNHSNNQKARPQVITQQPANQKRHVNTTFQNNSNAGNKALNRSVNSIPVNKKLRPQILPRSLHKTLKKAAVILLVVFVGYMIWDTFGPFGTDHLYGNLTSNNQNISVLADGKYYGFIEFQDGARQATYIQLRKSHESSTSFVIQIIKNVGYDPVFENIEIDNRNIFHSASLGEGILKVASNGKVTLVSTDKNSRSWYFEK